MERDEEVTGRLHDELTELREEIRLLRSHFVPSEQERTTHQAFLLKENKNAFSAAAI